MPVTININGLTLCHKGSDGLVHNTLPDVCKTPGKGIPIPYANEAYSRDLVKGTTTVFADGGNMIANLGSEFCKSIFDEPGSMGGIKSGTHLAEADWITHSFDVFFEGKPACRLTDKMFMNHRNTVSLGGEWQKNLAPSLVQKICDAICDCRNKTMPTAAQASEVGGDVVDAVRGVYDTTQDKASDQNQIHRRQDCFNEHFIESGDPWYGAKPDDPKVLVEVPYKANGTLIPSETGRTTYPGGPTAPGSIQRSLNVGKTSPKSVRWDMVVLKDSSKQADWDNVHKVLEIKFKGDDWTTNQKSARENTKIAAKVERVDEEDCFCDIEEEARRKKIDNIIKQFSDNLLKYLQMMPWGPKGGIPGGGRQPPLGGAF
jgi:hypothetical protein